jgi:hypothetical protein
MQSTPSDDRQQPGTTSDARPGDQPAQDQAPNTSPSPNGTPASTGDRPNIPAESPDDRITVGAGGVLPTSTSAGFVVPREGVDDEDDEEDVQGVGGCVIKHRRPGRREPVIVHPDISYTTKLLIDKPDGPDSVKEIYYYVIPALRHAVAGELKGVRVLLYFSVTAKKFGLWIVKITESNSYYESLHDKLLRQPPEFFGKYQVRVIADKSRDVYIVKRKLRTVQEVLWPNRPMDELLGAALGPEHIIATPDHPLIADLLAEEEVE